MALGQPLSAAVFLSPLAGAMVGTAAVRVAVVALDSPLGWWLSRNKSRVNLRTSVRTPAPTHAWMLRTLWAKTAVKCQTTLDSVPDRAQTAAEPGESGSVRRRWRSSKRASGRSLARGVPS